MGTSPVTSRELAILVDPSTFRRWHAWLIAELHTRVGTPLTLIVIDGGGREEAPAALGLLTTLESLLYGLSGEHAIDRVAPGPGAAASPATVTEGVGLAVDLTGGAVSRPAALRVLTPAFNGIAGLGGAVACILDRLAPRLSLADTAGPAIDLGLPAIEEPRVLLSALDNVLSRMAVAAAAALARLVSGDVAVDPCVRTDPALSAGAPSAAHGATRFLAAGLASKVKARLDRLLGTAPHWHLAWRRLPEIPGERPPPRELRRADYACLPDDGRRYFGDPFGFVHEGRVHVFCEEFPFATGKGVISTFAIDGDGRAGPARVVLERPHHLSYPQVFARDGEIWMMPEASGGGVIELFRAVRFPDRWELAARLAEGEYHDATFHAGPDRLWILASQSSYCSSTWDALSLLHADTLLGPWTRHQGNPVLIDAAAARPAGALRTIGGELWRPAQVCTAGYGRALAWCRVDALTPVRFQQTVVASTVFCPSDRTSGPHTWNEAGGFELIDLLGPRAAKPA